MKKLTIISLFIFWAFVTALMTAGLLLQEKNSATISGENAIQTNVNSQGVSLTREELAKHNNTSSCWLLIDAKIYDVTSYLNQHPGDASTILPTCGTDATQAYNTKGRPTSPSAHSQNAHELLKAYYIGDLGQLAAPSAQAIAKQTPQATTPKTTSATITLSAQEVAKHSTVNDCWMIVNNNVYNVTSYISRHPGGAANILAYCGKDGGAAFTGLPHSTNANQILASFLVGTLGQTATAQAIQQTTTPVIPAGAGEDEWEDD